MRGGGGMRRAYTIALYDAADETTAWVGVDDLTRVATTTHPRKEPQDMIVGAHDAPTTTVWRRV
jgi:hypothetical protein